MIIIILNDLFKSKIRSNMKQNVSLDVRLSRLVTKERGIQSWLGTNNYVLKHKFLSTCPEIKKSTHRRRWPKNVLYGFCELDRIGKYKTEAEYSNALRYKHHRYKLILSTFCNHKHAETNVVNDILETS